MTASCCNAAMSPLCHQRTHAAQQRAWSFVGTSNPIAATVGIRKADGGIALALCEASHVPATAKDDGMWPEAGTCTRVAGEVIE